MRRTVEILVVILMLSSACSEDKRLEITLLVSESVGEVDKLQVDIGSSTHIVQPGPDVSFGASDTVKEGSTLRVAVRGYHGSSLVGFGASPLFHAVDSAYPLKIWFAPPESLEEVPELAIPEFQEFGNAVALVDGYEWNPDDVGGLWGFGGYDATDGAAPSWYLDPYYLRIYQIPSMPVEVASPYVIPVSPTLALIFGGLTKDGSPMGDVFLYSSTCACSNPYYKMKFDGEALPPLHGGDLIRLGPYSQVTNNELTLTDAYLLVGAEGTDGTDGRVRVIAIYHNEYTDAYHIEAMATTVDGPIHSVRGLTLGRPGVTDGNEPGERDVVIAGYEGIATLHVSVVPQGEGFEWTVTTTSDSTAEDLSNAILFETKDGVGALVATENATCIHEAWVYDPDTSLMVAPLVVEGGTICSPYQVARVGDYLLVLGTEALYALTVKDDALTVVNSFPVERIGARLLLLPTGAVAVVGGRDRDGNPATGVMLFNPDPERIGLTMEVEDD